MGSSSNSRQVMWVAVGQFCAYAIGIVSPMILSRYLDKSDYGTYRQVMYVYSTLLVVFSFGLPRAYSYFIPRVPISESKDVIKKITRIFIIVGIIFSSVFFFFSHPISILLNNKDLEIALKCFSPTPLFLLPVLGLESILASYKRAQLIAVYSILTRCFSLLCIILPVTLCKGTYIHAIIGFDVASFITLLLAIYLRNIPTKGISLEKTLITFKEIFSFTFPLLAASLWIMIFESATQFFVSRYYGNEVFAEFSNGFVSFPIIPMVVGSIATVLMPVFSEKAVHNKGEIKVVWIHALTKTIKITYPIIIFCIVFASLIMSSFYGTQYENSSIYFMLKNCEGLFIIIPFYPILLSLGKSKAYSNIHMAIALFIIPMEFIVVLFKWPCILVCVVYVVCSFSKTVLQFLAVSRSINMTFRDLIPIKNMVQIIAISSLSAILPFFIFYEFGQLNKFLLLALTVFVFTVCYYCLCWVFHISYKDIFGNFISGSKFCKIYNFIP